jgi:hypothetical protein
LAADLPSPPGISCTLTNRMFFVDLCTSSLHW